MTQEVKCFPSRGRTIGGVSFGFRRQWVGHGPRLFLLQNLETEVQDFFLAALPFGGCGTPDLMHSAMRFFLRNKRCRS